MQKAYKAGVPVPTPARRVDNMFTMRFLGGEAKAPLLKDVILEEPDEAAEQAVALVEKLVDACIVHGDLSKYNIIFWDGKLFVIDFPQAIDFSSSMDRHLRVEEAKPLLLRDLRNLEDYFAEYSVDFKADAEYQRLLPKLDA